MLSMTSSFGKAFYCTQSEEELHTGKAGVYMEVVPALAQK